MDDSEGRKFQKKYRHKYKLHRDSGLPFPNYGLGKTELPTICRCYCNVADSNDDKTDKANKGPGENGTETEEHENKFQKSFSKSCSFYVTHQIDISTLYINGSFGTSSLTHRSPSFLTDAPYQSQAYYKKMKQREQFFSNVDADIDQYQESETKPESTYDKDSTVVPSFNKSSSFVQMNGDSGEKEEKLLLLPEEVIFLSFGVGCLSLLESTSSESLTYNFVWKKLVKLNPSFPYLYAVYHYFRSKNWVAKSGLQYGGDFVLYRAGPELFHSTYIVHIIGIPLQPKPSWTEIYGWQRVAASASKKTLLCEVIPPKNFTVETPRCIFEIKIFESVIERWFPTT